MLEAKFELLKLNDLTSILTRDAELEGIDEDADEDADNKVPSSHNVDDVLNTPMTHYQREKLIEILSSVDQINDRVDNLMDEVSKLSDKANSGGLSIGETLKGLSDIIANYQIDDIADKVDRIYGEIKPGSLFPKIGNTVSWIDHNVRSVKDKLSDCCKSTSDSLGQLHREIDLIGDTVGNVSEKVDALSTNLVNCCNNTGNTLNQLAQTVNDGFKDVGLIGDMVGNTAERLDALNANLIDCCNNTNNNLNQLTQTVNDGFNSTNQEVGSLKDDLLSAMMVIP